MVLYDPLTQEALMMLTLTPIGTLINASVNYVPGNPIYEAIQSLKAKLKGGLLTRPLTPNALEHALKALQTAVKEEEAVTYQVGLKEIEAYLFAYEFTGSYQQALVNAAHVFGQGLPEEAKVEQKRLSSKTTLRAKKPASEEKFSSSVNVIDSKSLKPSNGYLQSFFKGTLGTISQAVQYTKDNPGKVLLGGLAVQSMAVAAINPLGSRTGRELNHHGLQRSSHRLSNNSPNTLSLPTSLPVNRPGIEEILSSRKANKINTLSQRNKKVAERAVGEEFQINTSTLNDQTASNVASLTNGNFIVVYESSHQPAQGQRILGQLYDVDGNKLGSEFEAFTEEDGYEPAVAALDNGRFIITYANYEDLTSLGIYGRLFDANANPEGPRFLINTTTANNQHLPKVAALDNGNFMVVWNSLYQNFGNSSGDYGQLYHVTGSRIGPEFHINPTGTYVTIARLTNSNFIIAWSEYNGGIYGRVYSANGSSINDAFQINSLATAFNPKLSIAGLGNGGFVAAWHSNNGISAQLYDANSNRTNNEFLINSNTPNPLPSISKLNSNHFIVTWVSVQEDICGQIFTNNADRIGSEFLINSYLSASQVRPSVSNMKDNNFVVTWQSTDESGFGIYGKIIDTHLTATNTNQTTNYLENTPTALANIVITPPVFIANVTASLTLSDPLAGNLTTSTSGSLSSSYNVTNGTWQASGNVTDVNVLLSTIQFQPALGFNDNVRIEVTIEDGFNTPLNSTMTINAPPVLTTSSLTTSEVTTNPLTTQQGITTQAEAVSSSGDSGCDKGCLIGIGVGVGTGVAAVLGAIGFYAIYRSCKKNPEGLPKVEPKENPAPPASEALELEELTGDKPKSLSHNNA